MRRLLWMIPLLLVVIPLLLLAFVASDLDRFRGSIESLLADTLEREVSLDAPLALSLGRTITVSAGDIFIGNPTWASTPHFLRAGSASVSVEAPALLRGRLVVADARFSGIDINLESLPGGEKNWVFGTSEEQDAFDGEVDADTGIGILLKEFGVEASRLQYTGPLVEAPLRVAIDSAGQVINAQSYLEFGMTAAVNDMPLEAGMELGTLSRLESGGEVSLSLEATFGKLTVSAQGNVQSLREFAGPRGELRVDAPSYQYLVGLLNLRSRSDGPLSLAARLEDGGDRHAIDVQARLGRLNASLVGQIEDLAKLQAANLSGRIRGSDLAGLEIMLGLPEGSPGHFDVRFESRPLQSGGSQVDLAGSLLGLELGAAGVLHNARDGWVDSSIELQVAGPSLADTLASVGVDTAPDAPVDVTLSLAAEKGRVVVPKFSAAVGDNVLSGSGRWESGALGWEVDAPFGLLLAAPEQLLPSQWRTYELPAGLSGLRLEGRFTADPEDSSVEDMRLAVGGLALGADLDWSTADPLARIDIAVHGSGPSLSSLLPLWPAAHESPFEVSADVALLEEGAMDGTLVLGGDDVSISIWSDGDISGAEPHVELALEAQVLGTDLTGAAEYVAADKPRLQAQFQSQMLDLRPWIGGDDRQQEEAQVSREEAQDPGARLIPDMDLSRVRLPDMEASLVYRAQRLQGDLEHIDDLSISGELKNGALTVRDISFIGQGGGHVQVSIGVVDVPRGLDAWVRIAGSDISVGLPASGPEEVAQLPRYDLSLAYQAAGGTLREMAAGSHGYLRMASGPGKVDMAAGRMFTADFMTQLLNTVNPFAQEQDYTQLECSVVLAVVENGILVGEPALVVQTNQLQIMADASVDLATEVVDAQFKTIPLKGLGVGLSNLVTPFVGVSGTLASPSMGLDSDRAVKSGVATVATGGLNILAKSVYDRMKADDQPCETAIEAAREDFERLEAKYGNRWPRDGDL